VLLGDLGRKFGQAAARKLSGIRFCQNLEVQVYEFTFGDEQSKGKVNFGLIAMTKNGDSINAVSCVYSLDFSVAPERVTKTTKDYFLWFETSSSSHSWTEPKGLGFVTQRSLMNFCRLKALEEFQRRSIVSRVNAVSSISDVDEWYNEFGCKKLTNRFL